MVVRAAFTCKCGKVSCDGCINRENHLRSRNKEQQIIDASNAEAKRLQNPDESDIDYLVCPSQSEPEPELDPEHEQGQVFPEQKPSAKVKQGEGEPVKAKRTRRAKKGNA